MLSAAAACAALTAVLAGITGAWSPCGFSMVDTIGGALGRERRASTLLGSATFAVGAVVGGVITFGGLAELGALIPGGGGALRGALGALLAVTAAVADWRGVKIAPQIRRQVPERWRWGLPLPLASGLYGILMGLAFTTFVLAFAVWALAGISFATGDTALGAAVGAGFGAGRALPVLWMAPRMRDGRGARALEAMASEPRIWLGLRRLDALGLGLCALLLAGATASATASAARIANATEPSTAAGALAWQRPGGGGLLSTAVGRVVALPGTYPALGGALIGWVEGTSITLASPSTLAPVASVQAGSVNALALSAGWLVYRERSAAGDERLLALSLNAPQRRVVVAGPAPAGELGRPSLEGAQAVFSRGTPQGSAIELVDLATGARRALRSARFGAALTNPSILGGKLLYERTDRCSQQLLLGALATAARNRVLVQLPSTVTRDPGYEAGYEHAWNSASGCPNRGPGRGAGVRLGPTALGPASAYFTELNVNGSGTRVLSTR